MMGCVWGKPHQWGPVIDGKNAGKSHLYMDDDWGYYRIWPEPGHAARIKWKFVAAIFGEN